MTDEVSLPDFYERFQRRKLLAALRQQRWGEGGFGCPACGEDERWA